MVNIGCTLPTFLGLNYTFINKFIGYVMPVKTCRRRAAIMARYAFGWSGASFFLEPLGFNISDPESPALHASFYHGTVVLLDCCKEILLSGQIKKYCGHCGRKLVFEETPRCPPKSLRAPRKLRTSSSGRAAWHSHPRCAVSTSKTRSASL